MFRGRRPHYGVFRTARPVAASAVTQAAGAQIRRSRVRTFLSIFGILLLAAAARGQESSISRLGPAPKAQKPAPRAAGRGGTQALGAPATPATAGRGRGTASRYEE